MGATGLPSGVESPFETLRVDPDADAEEIEQAYRRRVMEAHPDHGGSASEFQRVRAAYEEITSGNGARVHSSGRGTEGGDDAAEPEPESETEPEPEPPDPEVEYLNYDVVREGSPN